MLVRLHYPRILEKSIWRQKLGLSNDLTARGLAGQPDGPRQTYRIEEAARLAGIGRNAMYDAAKRGDIPVIKIGRRLLIPKFAFDRLLENGR